MISNYIIVIVTLNKIFNFIEIKDKSFFNKNIRVNRKESVEDRS